MCFGSLPSVSEAARARRGGRGAAGAPRAPATKQVILFVAKLKQKHIFRAPKIKLIFEFVSVF